MNVKCPKCDNPMDIWQDLHNKCEKCGYVWDLEDKELALSLLQKGLDEIFPHEEGLEPVVLTLAFLERARFAKKQANIYEKVKLHIANIIVSCMENCTIITSDNQQYLQELIMSIYYEKNTTDRIKIFPSTGGS